MEYTPREIDNPNGILVSPTEQRNPKPDMDKKMPTALSDTDKNNKVKVAIQQQRIKLFVNRELGLETNI